MRSSISRVTGDAGIDTVVKLANEIWREHFTPIIGAGQVEYMLARFQDFPAITAQIESGAEYYLAAVDGRHVAYTGLIPDRPRGRMMISKLYVRLDARGAGVGTGLLDFIESECVTRTLDTLWLTVNRFNTGPVGWYRRHGFVVVDELKQDIGCGFYMDDFIMEKRIETT